MALSYRNLPGLGAVGADAPHLGRQVEQQLRPVLGQQPVAGRAVDQVVVAAARHEQVGDAAGPQGLDQEAAEEPAAAGHHDPLAGQGGSAHR